MSERPAIDRILPSLHDAMLDETQWPVASGLIDDACRTTGNFLTFADGRSQDDVEIYLAWFHFRGERHFDLEREYFDVYYPRDERVPRLRQLPDSRLVHVVDLYTDEELKSSPAYNEVLVRGRAQNGLNVRLDGPNGSRIVWTVADPVDGDGWSSAQTGLIREILPHLRQFVRVRQALVDAGALGASLTRLLEKSGAGIIHLDSRERIVAMNDRVRDLLRKGDTLFDRGGLLAARSPADAAAIQGLLARALPRFGERGASGSITLSRPNNLPGLTVHVSPVGNQENDFRPRRVAALVLVVDHEPAHIDLALVESNLGLTPTEGQVAVLLAEGRTVREIAAVTGRRVRTVRWHVQQIFDKLGISRQVDLVREVLSLTSPPDSRS